MKSTGRLIAQLRKDLGLSQDDLALRLGCTKQAISNYELDKRAPSIEALRDLSRIFDVPIDFLCQNPPFHNWDELTADWPKFLDLLHDLTDIPENMLNTMRPNHVMRIFGLLFAKVEIDPDTDTYAFFPNLPVEDLQNIWKRAHE